ncbi:MAG: 2,3-bisphosphoglycerate-independent phosphoglycerate mutase [Acidimicrobiia bacterium]|nr:2,3-bisphosphoglycerate-independent phosphoglycerate mutase [Acidimicrobiia bacterium]MCY4432476.1 2,3-bisphosphoglycerate-independent phosphoglycerate mutase [bacterium]
MKYVVCIPDGCADLPVPELDGATSLEAAHTPVLDALAARGQVGLAQVIPPGMPAGSDVGNMSIFGYDPARYHTGRSPIEAAALGLTLSSDQVAYRCNLVTVTEDGIMADFSGGHPDSEQAAEVIAALDTELGGEVSFHAGVQYRHTLIAPAEWADAVCTPPHDLSDQPIVGPSGPAGPKLAALEEASRSIVSRFGLKANRIWLWGQGFQPEMPSFREMHGVEAGMVSAVDLVRGIGALTNMSVTDVAGATAWYDTNYEGKRDAALAGLAAGADLYVIHVEASDEAGHEGNVAEKVRCLENWDRRILAGLVDGLDKMGPWRLLLLPDHATPLTLRGHIDDPVPYLLVDSQVDGPGGVYTERGAASSEVVPGHCLMAKLLAHGETAS